MMNLNDNDVQWCVSRLPSIVRGIMEDNPGRVVLAGGYIRSMIANETVNDIDLFPCNKYLAKGIFEQIKSSGDYAYAHESGNAYTVRFPGKPAIQIIHRWVYDDVESLLQSFDFTVARAAIWFDRNPDQSGSWFGVCDKNYYEDLAAKRLVYCYPRREEEPGGSMLRAMKFITRGYRMPLDSLSGVIARIALGVDMERLNDLGPIAKEEAYAKIILGLLREVDPNAPLTVHGEEVQ